MMFFTSRHNNQRPLAMFTGCSLLLLLLLLLTCTLSVVAGQNSAETPASNGKSTPAKLLVTKKPVIPDTKKVHSPKASASQKEASPTTASIQPPESSASPPFNSRVSYFDPSSSAHHDSLDTRLLDGSHGSSDTTAAGQQTPVAATSATAAAPGSLESSKSDQAALKNASDGQAAQKHGESSSDPETSTLAGNQAHGNEAAAGSHNTDKPIEATSELPLSVDEVTMPSNYSLPAGYTNRTDEACDYYNLSLVLDPAKADELWVDLDSLPETVSHDMLSQSYRRAATVNLSFPFPFYGHPINNVTIATGGFLYVGYALHMWLAATQYIAPLMANFMASVNSGSALKYYDNGTVFVVEWRNVHLDDRPTAGNFTFQTILHANGDIVFVYREIPIPISDINERFHPVKVGISDAYLFNRMVFLLKRKTIYEYHAINKKSDELRSHTAIIMRALPTCLSLTTCEECTSAQINFNCTWCEAVQRCSSGVDRHRESWVHNKCEETAAEGKDSCPVSSANALASAASARNTGNAGGLSALFILLVMVVGLVGWLVYAYRNPGSTSGQLLIKYRPSQWKRHGEARYIAAGSLHM